MRKKTFDHTLCFGLLVSCVLLLVSEYLAALLLSHIPDLLGRVWVPWAGIFFCTCAVAFPAFLLLTKSLDSVPPASRSLPLKPFFCLILLCLFIVSCSFFLQAAATFYTIPAPASFDSVPSLLCLILFSCILSPLAEEYVFRKTLLDKLFFVPPKTRLLFGAFVFALFHMNPFQFVYSFLLGLTFGILYLCTGKLSLPALMHMLCNLWGAVFFPLLKLNLPYFPHKRLFYMVLAAATAAAVIFMLLSFLLPKGKYAYLLPPAAAHKKTSSKALFLNPSLLIYIMICFIIMLRG